MGSSIFSSSSFGFVSNSLYLFSFVCEFPVQFYLHVDFLQSKVIRHRYLFFDSSGSSFRGIRLSLDSTSLILFLFLQIFFQPVQPTCFRVLMTVRLYIREFLHRRKWFPAARRHVSRFDEHTRILAPWRNAQPITSAEILSDSRSASTFVTGHGRFTSESRVAFLFLASNRHLEITTDSILWG